MKSVASLMIFIFLHILLQLDIGGVDGLSSHRRISRQIPSTGYSGKSPSRLVRADKGLTFDKGDIISCNVDGLVRHVFLATSNSTVAYIVGEIGFSRRSPLRESSFRKAARKYNNCKVVTAAYDERMTRFAPAFTDEEAVERARSDIKTYGNDNVYYDILFCNCEHWVIWWKYGISQSPQAFNFKTRSPCAI